MSRQARQRANGEVASALELDEAAVLRAFRDIDRTRQATDVLWMEPVFIEPAPARGVVAVP